MSAERAEFEAALDVIDQYSSSHPARAHIAHAELLAIFERIVGERDAAMNSVADGCTARYVELEAERDAAIRSRDEMDTQLTAMIRERDAARSELGRAQMSGDVIMIARAYLAEHMGPQTECAFFDDCIHNAVALWAKACAERDAAVERAGHWHAFGCLVWVWLADHWDSEDGWDIAQMAVTAGLAERVKYDPAIHGECEADPGDEITYPLKGDPAFVNVAALRAEVAALTAECQRLELAAAEAMALVMAHESRIEVLTADNEWLRAALHAAEPWAHSTPIPIGAGLGGGVASMTPLAATVASVAHWNECPGCRARAALAPRAAEGVK